jgi:hypothetical protein
MDMVGDIHIAREHAPAYRESSGMRKECARISVLVGNQDPSYGEQQDIRGGLNVGSRHYCEFWFGMGLEVHRWWGEIKKMSTVMQL